MRSSVLWFTPQMTTAAREASSLRLRLGLPTGGRRRGLGPSSPAGAGAPAASRIRSGAAGPGGCSDRMRAARSDRNGIPLGSGRVRLLLLFVNLSAGPKHLWFMMEALLWGGWTVVRESPLPSNILVFLGRMPACLSHEAQLNTEELPTLC